MKCYNSSMYKKRHWVRVVVGRVAFLIAFFTIATLVIISAAGLKIELKERRVVQTSMIIVSAQPVDATLSLDGEMQDGKSPWRLNGLMSGVHKLEIAKKGYDKWSKNINLSPGETALVEEPILYLTAPTELPLDADNQDGLVANLDKLESDSKIKIINGNELWRDNKLVTRVSQAIYKPRTYQDDQHISFLSGGWLHIIDIDGSNDYTPVQLDENDNYLFTNKGMTLVYKKGGIIRALKVR